MPWEPLPPGGPVRPTTKRAVAIDTEIYATLLVLPTKDTTGDPTSPIEGQTYVNLFDNKVRCYADGAWRDLVTW